MVVELSAAAIVPVGPDMAVPAAAAWCRLGELRWLCLWLFTVGLYPGRGSVCRLYDEPGTSRGRDLPCQKVTTLCHGRRYTRTSGPGKAPSGAVTGVCIVIKSAQ